MVITREDELEKAAKWLKKNGKMWGRGRHSVREERGQMVEGEDGKADVYRWRTELVGCLQVCTGRGRGRKAR